MKKTTHPLKSFLIFSTIIALIGCTTEKISEKELLTNATTTVLQKTTCKSCSKSIHPGSNKTFNTVLAKMDLEHKWNGGLNQNNHAKPHTWGACDSNFFTQCNDRMLLSSTGGASDRTELKTPIAYNQYLNSYSQMRFEAQITEIPVSKIYINDGVTIAQIHNRGYLVERPLARVDIAGYAQKVQVTFASGYKKIDGQRSTDLVHYNEGDDLYVRIKINPQGNSVSIYVRNKTTNQSKSTTWTIPNCSNWNEKDGTYYYKTGVYQQLSGKKPSISYKYLHLDSL